MKHTPSNLPQPPPPFQAPGSNDSPLATATQQRLYDYLPHYKFNVLHFHDPVSRAELPWPMCMQCNNFIRTLGTFHAQNPSLYLFYHPTPPHTVPSTTSSTPIPSHTHPQSPSNLFSKELPVWWTAQAATKACLCGTRDTRRASSLLMRCQRSHSPARFHRTHQVPTSCST
jgi:hypothetical protein